MDQHDDLLAAALNAVEAVEAHALDDTQNANSDTLSHEIEMSNNNADSSSSIPVNAEGGHDDDPDIQFSISAFGSLLDDDNEPAETNSGISLVGLDALANDIAESEAEKKSAETGLGLQQKYDSALKELETAVKKSKDLQTENDQLRVIQKQLNDRLVRISADFDNYRKRVLRDQEASKNQAEEKIVAGFLPVMDNLERALSHARQSDDYQQLLKGVEMTGKLYLAALAKLGCVPYDSLGAEFDPVYHDVLQRVIDAEKPHNSIIQEHLRGYMMHERVLRPALVVVAQHEESEDTQSEGENE